MAAATTARQERVLIVGGGLGGLALAQILRGKNIPYEVFERDASVTARKQGWAVGLVEALPHLKELLPSDLGDIASVSVNHRLGVPDQFAVVNGRTGDVIAKMGSTKPSEPGFLIRADRQLTRNFLSQNLDIRMGKAFSHYVEDREGVTAFFEDGTSARGTLLVGADGAHSRVRSQLLDNKHPEVLSQFIPIVGEAEVPRHVYEKYQERASAGILAPTEDSRLMVGMRDIAPDGAMASMYYFFAYRSDDPAADSAWARAASAQSLYRRVVEGTSGLAPWIMEVIRYGGEKGMVRPPVAFLEFVPPSSLPRGRVTLLGDAAHTMVPFRGAGANTAFTDACDLARGLVAGLESGTSLDWILHEYENIMLPRGRDLVLSSRASGESLMGVLHAAKGRYVNLGDGKAELMETDEQLRRLFISMTGNAPPETKQNGTQNGANGH